MKDNNRGDSHNFRDSNFRDSLEAVYFLLLPILCAAALLRGCSAHEEQKAPEPPMTQQEFAQNGSEGTAVGTTVNAAGGAVLAQTSGKAGAEDEAEQLTSDANNGQEASASERKITVKRNPYDPDKFSYIGNSENITYEDENYEALQGIDVSDHQGEIDWKRVADAGYDFVFVRAGFRGYGEEGTLNEDTMAIEYMQEAEEAGLEVGAYFFSQAINEEEAAEEARFAAEVIKKSGVQLDLPLVYDPELAGGSEGRANHLSREQISDNARAFKRAAEEAMQCKVAIYTNLFWQNTYFDLDVLNDFEIWYADYQDAPQTNCHFTWWQYSETGYVPGIKGDMDLNLWIRRID